MTREAGHSASLKEPQMSILDPNEAPPGYIAVLKADVSTDDNANICRQCDWRPHCDGLVRCMPYELQNGLKRFDGCSVVFKKIVPEKPSDL